MHFTKGDTFYITIGKKEYFCTCFQQTIYYARCFIENPDPSWFNDKISINGVLTDTYIIGSDIMKTASRTKQGTNKVERKAKILWNNSNYVKKNLHLAY